MSYYDRDVEEEWGPFTLQVKWEADDDCGQDFLDGNYVSHPTGYLYVDRTKGIIVSPESTVIQKVVKADIEPFNPALEDWDDYLYGLSQYAWDLFDRGDIEGYADVDDEPEAVYDWWDGLLAMTATGYEILVYDLPTRDSWGYEYFENPDAYSDKAENAKYLAQDYQRVEDYNAGHWSFLYCKAELLLDGEEVASDAMGGMCSDEKDEYLETVEQQIIDEAKAILFSKIEDFADNEEVHKFLTQEVENERRATARVATEVS